MTTLSETALTQTGAPVAGKTWTERLGVSQVEGVLWFCYTLTAFVLLVMGINGYLFPGLLPETGMGYWIGLVGGSMMLILLIYPLRKRIKSLRSIGKIGFWFRFHMILGIAGPMLVLYHGRFSFGHALNTKMAMWSMLLVVGSGFVGRFIYSRIHRGYTGRKLEMRQILTRLREEMEEIGSLGTLGDQIRHDLQPLEARAIAAGGGFWSSATSILTIGIGSRVAMWRIRRKLRALPSRDGTAQAHKHILRLAAQSTLAARRAAAFAYYDRMFRLWHLLHLPLLFLLLGAGFLHVWAVHKY